MTWPVNSIGSVGCCYGQRGNWTEPMPPSVVLPAEAGCGDYFDFQAYEARQEVKDKRREREERFDMPEYSLPADIYSVVDGVVVCRSTGGKHAEYPWDAVRRERVEIGLELWDQGLRGRERDEAIDLTMFARRFVRWAEDGFPMGGS